MAGKKGKRLSRPKPQAVTRLSSRQFTQALKKGTLKPKQVTAYRVKHGDALTPLQRGLIHRNEKLARRAVREKKTAYKARELFKPAKKDRGKIVLVGPNGGKLKSQARHRKGIPVYVTAGGKKRLLRQKREPYKLRKAAEIQLAASKNLRRKKEAFERSRLELTARGAAVIRKAGKVTTGGRNDFSKAIKPLARSLKVAIEGQRSHRSFLVSVNVLMRDQSGTFPVSFDVPIDKADSISIKLGGLENFVRLKVYAFLAQQLAYAGYITAGSANHIRRAMDLEPGEEVTEEIWEEYHAGQGRSFSWQAPRFSVARIERIEWKIQQAK